MKRTILACGGTAFVMAFLGTMMAINVSRPTLVAAQDSTIRAESVTVSGGNGTDQVRLSARPTGGGVIQALDADGTLRVQAATGGAPPGQPPNPLTAGINVYQPNGRTLVARLGTGERNDGTGDDGTIATLVLDDQSGRTRISSRVDEDGYPSLVLLSDEGRARASLRAQPDGSARLSLLNADGQARAALSTGAAGGVADEDVASLNLWSPDRSHPMVHLAVDHGLSGDRPLSAHLVISDEQRSRIFIGTTDNGDPTIELYDADGNVTWSAP
ncbi:MAG TPA: hypothetical protein VFC51_03410 [Chloroflexota bacterium]|nr:hypothetical protein [Chloroflexota bacterium]